MNQSQKETIDQLKVPCDLIAIILAWICAWFLRFYTLFDAPKGIPDFQTYAILIPFILVIWWGAFQFSGFYVRSKRRRSAVMEALDILQSCAVATLAFIAFSYYFDDYIYSRLVIAIFAVLQVVFLIGARSFLRKATRRWLRSLPPRKILMIASGENMRSGAELARTGALGKCELSVLSLDNEMTPSGQPKDWKSLKMPLAEVGDFLLREQFEGMVLSVASDHSEDIAPFLEEWSQQITDIQILPDISQFRRFGASVEIVDGKPMISVHRSPLEGSGAAIKRFVDIIGGLTALVLFSPVMGLSALFVKLSSPGPVFYKQERMSLDGRTFNILKFRSLPTNSEKTSGAVWAKATDGRATKVGSFLRKTSLDELPQLFNVLQGSMSLVGPRPERPVFVDQFRRQVPGYMLRHKVKAGMTGWAQINGWRGNTSIEKRIECDLFYIQNWSIMFDIKILVLTVFKGFVNNNAY